jgi:zinc transporter, ZIP family
MAPLSPLPRRSSTPQGDGHRWVSMGPMSLWYALIWGGVTSGSLYIGEALAGPMKNAHRLTGVIMGFGAGTLLSAVAYELIPETTISQGPGIGVGFLAGALAYFVADLIIDSNGGADRQQIRTDHEEGSGAAMFLGALLDGLPEALILGISLALGDAVSLAFVSAVFVSNIPQGIAGTHSLKAAGYSDRHVFAMWTGLTALATAFAGAGFLLGDAHPGTSLYASAFAAGAVLVMLADSMMPEAFRHGGRQVGLFTVVGYLAAAALATGQG